MNGTINHHLTEATLVAYSAGSLPEAFALVAATHVSLCDDCRARLEAYEALGGEVLAAMPAAEIDEDSFEATMARISGGSPVAEVRPIKVPGIFPAPLQAYIGGDLAAVKWRPVGMGVRQAILPVARGATVRLLHIPAGGMMPDHGHRGREMTLVLKGAYSDADGRYARGDVEVADEAVQHRPVAEPGEDCVCLAATEAPLRFRALIPRLVQPFFRI